MRSDNGSKGVRTASSFVTVASFSGLTPQYAGLRTLHEDHLALGFSVLAFPCNQFGAQEPGTDEEILEFAASHYDATFPIFSKIEVNGDGACELYQWLRAAQPGDGHTSNITWIFEEFLVGYAGSSYIR